MKVTTNKQKKQWTMLWFRNNLLLLTSILLLGCQVTTEDSIGTAHPYIGLEERQHRKQIKELVGVDLWYRGWSAAFVNAVLAQDGIPGSESVSDNPLLARSFLYWGSNVQRHDIRRGDIVVFPRGNEGWKGHVGFYVETQIYNGKEYWVILGGNQDNKVRYERYNPYKSIGIRRYIQNKDVQ